MQLGARVMLPRRFAKHVIASEIVKNEVESWGLQLLPTSREVGHWLCFAWSLHMSCGAGPEVQK